MLLKKLKIENAVWCSVENGQYYQVCIKLCKYIAKSYVNMLIACDVIGS